MERLVWLESAIADLVRLRKFIDRNNPNAAKRAAKTIDLLHNSTSAGNLCVGAVLESSRTFEYAAVLRSDPPTNSLAEANSARGLIKKAVITLIEFPLTGKPVTNLIDYRDLYIRFGLSGYILRYRIYDDTIYVVHIRHDREMEFK
ncbi:type II toxin-antitoxin system RelE/ParE family toxin [Candidatus Tisiphia endosymbiont of Stenodema calcarata]|uniref:type II toxin-antitoxin system RelE/ParE family toxin n=1 Tax=Candidatus Tisiphia endosymbiont of Stenodema calcarata TaxID=3139337 RepID=UPI003CCAF2E8